jgi:hypothetical protein
MSRAQHTDPEQQRVEDGRERAALVGKLNAAIEAIAANEKRFADAEAKLAKLVNDAKSEIGTAKRELQRSIEAYEALRHRMVVLLQAVPYVMSGAELEIPTTVDDPLLGVRS